MGLGARTYHINKCEEICSDCLHYEGELVGVRIRLLIYGIDKKLRGVYVIFFKTAVPSKRGKKCNQG